MGFAERLPFPCLRWVRDPDGDYCDADTVAQRIPFRFFQDYIDDLTHAGTTLGSTIFGMIGDALGYQDSMNQAIYNHLGQEAGELVISYWQEEGALSTEDVWNYAEQAKQAVFEQECEAACENLAGQPR